MVWVLKIYSSFFFSFQGYECEPFNNPADFFLDIINGDSTAVAASKEDHKPADTGKGKLSRRNSPLAFVEGKLHMVTAKFYSLCLLQSKNILQSLFFC